MNKSIYFIVAGLLVVAFVAAMPLSNFFLKREKLTVKGGPEFQKASVTLQNKCADCHSPGMISRPIYFGFPIASQIIEKDMEAAQAQIQFKKEQLMGDEPFKPVDLARIGTVVQDNVMPPPQYKILHWDAGLTKDDRDAILAWIMARPSE